MSKCKLALNAILVLLLFLPFAHAAVSEEQVQSVGSIIQSICVTLACKFQQSSACWKT